MTPTITQLISLLDKPALLKWANKIGLEGTALDDYRSKSQASGASIHDQIQAFLEHGLPFEEKDRQVKFESFIGRYEVIAVEKDVEHELFHGRTDLLLSRDGKLYTFDFKASNRIYFEQKLQLLMYKKCLNSHFLGIVNTESYREIFFRPNDQQEKKYWEIIEALATIYHAKSYLGE